MKTDTPQPFNFDLKLLAAHVSLPRLVHDENVERVEKRRILETLLMNSLANRPLNG